MRQTTYQREHLGCGDCVHFDACAQWNEGELASMQMCEVFTPRCENCRYSRSATNTKCECSVLLRKTRKRFFCEKAKVK